MESYSSTNIRFGDYLDVVANIARLRDYSTYRVNLGDMVMMAGSATPGDGNGGAYTWVPESLALDDGKNVICPHDRGEAGRWKLSAGKGDTGQPGDKGDAGQPGDAVGSRVQAMALSIPATARAIRTTGYNVGGDGGAALYARVTGEPTHSAKFRTMDRYLPNGTADLVNGGWWQLAETRIIPEYFGAVSDAIIGFNGIHGGSDNTDALQAAIDFCCRPAARGTPCIPLYLEGRYKTRALTVSNAYQFSIIADTPFPGLVADPSVARDSWIIKIKDSADVSVENLIICGNANLPDGAIIIENNGLHNRSTNAMARVTIRRNRFSPSMGGFGFTRLIRITDNQQFVDNNSEHFIFENHFWGYTRSAISMETRNSLQNSFRDNHYSNTPSTNLEGVCAVETVSLMRPLIVGGTPVEQGGGGFIMTGGNLQIHGGLNSTRNTTAVAIKLRGQLLQDIEIGDIAIEDNCRFIDIDATANPGGIFKVSISQVHQKGGASGPDSASAIPTMNYKTGDCRLIVDMHGCSIGLGAANAVTNLDGSNVFLSFVGGIFNQANVIGTGNLSLIGCYGAPGLLTVANTLQNFIPVGYQGNYSYMGRSVDGTGTIGLFKTLNLYDGLHLRTPGKNITLTPSNTTTPITLFPADDMTMRMAVGDGIDKAVTAMEQQVFATVPSGAALPAGAVGWRRFRVFGGYNYVAVYN